MHEFSLIADLFRKIEETARREGAPRVTGVRVRLGALAHISAEHFRDHFRHAAQGTVADGACLEVIEDDDPHSAHAQEIRLESLDVSDDTPVPGSA